MALHRVHSIHDRFIKRLLADKELAVSFLQEFLPAQLSQQLDFDTLTPLETSYLSPALRASFSDMIWHVKLKTEELLRICLLLEHKSFIDSSAAFQLLEYLALGYQKQLQGKRAPELIVPILYYHGRQKWNFRGIDSFFSRLPERWHRYLPGYEPVFIDLQQLSVTQIEGLRNGLLRSAVMVQRYYFDPEGLNQNIINILQSLSGYLETSAAETIFVYLISNGSLNLPKFKEEMKTLPPAFSSKAKSLYDQLIEEGIEKGKADVVRNLIQTGKFTVSEIADLVNLPESVVKDIAKAQH